MEAKWAMQQKEALKKNFRKIAGKVMYTEYYKNSNDSFTFLVCAQHLLAFIPS